jgi:hypothetical protein
MIGSFKIALPRSSFVQQAVKAGLLQFARFRFASQF